MELTGEQGVNGSCGYCGGSDCGCNPLEADEIEADNEDLFDQIDES